MVVLEETSESPARNAGDGGYRKRIEQFVEGDVVNGFLNASAKLAVALIVVFAQSTANASTKTIARMQSDALRVLVVESSDGISLALRASGSLTDDTVSIQTLHAPERVVIDLPKYKQSLTTDKKEFEQHPLLRGIRIGAHPNKTRLVVDLQQATTGHEVTRVDELGALLVHLKFSETASHAETSSKTLHTVATVEVPAKPEKNQVLSNKDSSSAQRARLARAGAFLDSRGVIVHRGVSTNEDQESAELPRTGTVQKIAITQRESSDLDSLILEIESLQEFSLTPVTESRFELRLTDTANDACSSAITGVGFESVTCRDEAPDAVLDIQMNTGVTLAPLRTPDTLVLRAIRK